MKYFLKKHAILIALIIMIAVLSIVEPVFSTPTNLSNLARQVTSTGIIALGMTMVILVAGIDLSVGSLVGLSAIVVAKLMQTGMNPWLAVIITILLTGVLAGLWNGFWISYFKIPAFIITLGMMTIARGLALIISNQTSVPASDKTFATFGGGFINPFASTIIIIVGMIFFIFLQFNSLKQKKKYGIKVNKTDLFTSIIFGAITFVLSLYIFNNNGTPDLLGNVIPNGIPMPVIIFVVLALICSFVLSNTKFGRRIYAIGGNEEAARLSGINVFRTVLIIYVIVSALSALSGIILTSRLGGASPNLGNTFELDAIAAVVIGGTSLLGGSGKIVGTVIGVMIIGVLNNGLSLMGVITPNQFVIKGLIIILAALFDVLNKKHKG